MSKSTNILEDWDFFFCRIDEKPASIRLNLALNRIAPFQAFPFRFSCLVKMQNPDENGFSSNEEYPVLGEIEDAIQEKMEKMGAIYTGVIKNNGILELVMYAQELTGMEEACRSVLNTQFPSYECDFDTEEDPQWHFYQNFMYPDAFSLQQMMNRRVIRQLEAQGDQLDRPRSIDHWLYFSSEAKRQEFIKSVENEGFQVLSTSLSEEGDYRFVLNIARENCPEEMDEVVWALISLAEPLDGIYDGWGCNVEK